MKLGGLSMTLGAAGALALLIVGASLSTTAGSNPDADGDGVVDLVDNCLGKANAVNAQGWQDDCDFDGFGDACDGDFDNSGHVTVSDFIAFGQTFKKDRHDGHNPAYNTCADADGNGTVNVSDFISFGQQFKKGPGPSGLKCASRVSGSANLTGKNRCWFLPNHRVRCTHKASGRAAGANDDGVLTDTASGRDLRFLNKRHYADLHGAAGGHCVYP